MRTREYLNDNPTELKILNNQIQKSIYCLELLYLAKEDPRNNYNQNISILETRYLKTLNLIILATSYYPDLANSPTFDCYIKKTENYVNQKSFIQDSLLTIKALANCFKSI